MDPCSRIDEILESMHDPDPEIADYVPLKLGDPRIRELLDLVQKLDTGSVSSVELSAVVDELTEGFDRCHNCDSVCTADQWVCAACLPIWPSTLLVSLYRLMVEQKTRVESSALESLVREVGYREALVRECMVSGSDVHVMLADPAWIGWDRGDDLQIRLLMLDSCNPSDFHKVRNG